MYFRNHNLVHFRKLIGLTYIHINYIYHHINVYICILGNVLLRTLGQPLVIEFLQQNV